MTDEALYKNAYRHLGSEGLDAVIEDVPNATTFKLITGEKFFNPARPSRAGRGFGEDFLTIYLADTPMTASGETIPNLAVPADSILGEYLISGHMINFDRIGDEEFQRRWRAWDEPDKHEFSQGFSSWLRERDLIPEDVIGGSWRSISCEQLGLEGRCYCVTVSGEKYMQFQREYGPPEWQDGLLME